MIVPVTMYTIVCDNCGKRWVDTDDQHSAYSDAASMWDVANDSGWAKENNKHYCDGCWSYNDEDEIVLKAIQK